MADITIKEYKIYNLQKEYNIYSLYLLNYQNHVKRCYTDMIINIKERNEYYKMINNILRQMNSLYNSIMMEIDSDTSSESSNSEISKLSDIFPTINNDTYGNIYDEIRNLINLCRILKVEGEKEKYELLSQEPFIKIKKLIIDELASKIGFYSIDDGLTILLGEQYETLYDNNKELFFHNKISFYNKIFIPLLYNIRRINNNKQMFIKNTELDIDTLINNTGEMYIKKIDTDEYICFKGYFIHDNLNIIIKTSQICNNFFYEKKKEIINYIHKKSNINNNFIKTYIRNCDIHDFIINTPKEFNKIIIDDFCYYTKLIKMSFIKLIKEFINDKNKDEINIKKMFKIIKLLLLGSNENINIAGLLFGISKDKNPDNKIISEIIFKNLNYNLQNKIKKVPVNIKNTLEKIKSISIDDVDLRNQIIVCKNMPDNVKRISLDKIEEMNSSGGDYYKQLMYVKYLLRFPWISKENDNYFAEIGKDDNKRIEYLDNFDKKLNSMVYGHKRCKTVIKQLIGRWLTNPSSSGTAIGLVGPPGVGKTLIAKAIGEAMDIPFIKINLGGQNDGEILIGHGYTYSNAQPGILVKKMVEHGNTRCIMYFDELDKACKKSDNNEIFNILIHLIDKNTNNEFSSDRFFQDISFPFEKVVFIFSYNRSSDVDPILLDRIKEIEIKPFKLYEKIDIFKQFLVKETHELIGFNKNKINFSNNVIEFIIDKYTDEPGVRELKRCLEDIFLKLNMDRIYKRNKFKNNNNNNKSIDVTKNDVEKIINRPQIHIQKIHDTHLVGIINGLYVTDNGKGGILPIQIEDNYADDKFTLRISGSQKRVMRESVISAFTSAIHCIREDIKNEYLKKNKYGFHIHTPSGSIPKDGPSAGCAFATAFVSKILNKKIYNNVAITGEIELTGKVTKIGGLFYKLTGAKKSGVELVLISKDNECDLNKIKKEYKKLLTKKFKVIPIENLKDVLKYVLVDYDPNEII